MSRWLRCRLIADRVLAAALSVVTAPVVAVLALLVRRHDGGSPLISVPRVGRGGEPFGMWKIRSMRAETADGRATGVALTSTNDDRVTPIGARMRSLHLDELPQLYNVVRGEMSLLGPRPEAPEFVDLADPAWQAVLAVPPGIAGPTQLIVGDWEKLEIDADPTGDAYQRTVVPVKLAIDRWYVRSSSPLLDLLVARSFIGHVLPHRDIAALRRRVSTEVPESSAVDLAPVPVEQQ